MKQKTFFPFSSIKKIILLISLFPLVLSAQPKVYTIDDAINQALLKNKGIAISQLNVSKAGAYVNEAFGYALPS